MSLRNTYRGVQNHQSLFKIATLATCATHPSRYRITSSSHNRISQLNMSTKYTLFDIPSNSTPPACWSPNCWKARGVLNYKNVPYETEWLEYPDIRVRLAEFGLPSKTGLMPYTLPMLRVTTTPEDGTDPKVTYFTDSADIAKYINEEFPTPAMDFNEALTDEITAFFGANLQEPFIALVLCDVPSVLLPRSAEYFNQTRAREDWMGMPLPDLKKKMIEKGNAWEKMETGIGKVRELLRKNGGPFILGEKVSFGDMKLAGYMLWAKVGAPEVWPKVKEWGGEEVERFMAAAEEKKISARLTY
ncbi:hypothetical protein TWF694_009843 [Orbilia ellipsospora]|uniref:GST N-terminal domain-containing protein n=1 Tax=Orbilia ellipsospora TaxID=2528407 RepID=A0AAV9XDE5_9PEZI